MVGIFPETSSDKIKEFKKGDIFWAKVITLMYIGYYFGLILGLMDWNVWWQVYI